MDRRIEVALVTGALGLGGTEKGLVTHALTFDPEVVAVRVVAVNEGGPRRAHLEAAGVPVSVAGGDEEELARLLEGVDVVHVFRGGLTEPLVPAAVRRAGVPHLVETNVFGAVDASPDRFRFDCHLFVGKMCAWRYRERLGLSGADFHDQHRVLHWPIDLFRLRAMAPERREAKRRLGLDPDRPVVGRVGRDDDTKWRRLLVDMIPELLRLAPETQVMLVGATPDVERRLQRLGVREQVHLVDTTPSEAEVALRFAACDVFITAAEIGESYSVAISEAMGLGLPIVTCSTPWVDNGQIEQVDEGVTGHIADHPRAFAEACAAIVGEPDRAARMGRAAAEKADRLMDAVKLTRQLESLYAGLVTDGRAPEAWWPDGPEVDAFGDEYAARLERSFRPLTGRERRQVRAARRGERLRWAWRARKRADARTVWAALKARLGHPS